MSTQQALGVIGGVVGSFFGYPQLGFVVGSLVGGLLTPKEKIEGPRVEDLKVQVSTYGAGIPVVYGNARVGGNVIWSTDKIETETTEDVGKGGGAEQTTYRYFVHMRIRLCETPSDGQPVLIRKIWQDGKLIYDASSGVPLGSAIASAENPHAFLVLYQGHEDQLPDPIEEQFLGIGNVPAYRGGVDVRMNAVECPGGRVPQFSFEICIGASTSTAINNFYTSAPYSLLNSVSYAPDFSEIRVLYGRNWSNAYDQFGVEVVYIFPDGSSSIASRFTASTNRPPARGNSDETCFLNTISSASNTLHYYNADGAERLFVYPGAASVSEFMEYSKKGNFLVVGHRDGIGTAGPFVFQFDSGVLLADLAVGTKVAGVALTDTSIYILRDSVLEKWSLNSFTLVSTLCSVAGYTNNFSRLFVANDSEIYVNVSGTVKRYVNGALVTKFTGMDAALGNIFGSSFHVRANMALGNAGNGFQFAQNGLTTTEASVAAIIADQCGRAGLQAGKVDLAGIADNLHGYTLATPASARSNLQPLMTAFAIDATEEDGKLKFFKRASKVSVATILYEELGTVEGDSEAGDPMPLTRAQDAELPRSVSASYTNKDFDYQTGTEKAIRQIFDSQNDMMVDLAMSTSSDHAATVAQAILYDSHNDRNKRSMKVSRKYAFLSAGDVVTVEYPATILSQWRIVKITDTGALIEIDCVPFDAAIYTQTAVGATGYAGQQVAPLPPPTRLQLLDIPILRDADNNAGLYGALAGFGPGWPGGYLQFGDDINSMETNGTVEREAAQGFAETVLGNWTSGIVDESNLLTVNVGHSELNSINYDTLLTGTANVAAIGDQGRWEIVKFRNAASLGGGRYILSGFMRGQRGTEWARGTHAVNDTFVLLSMAGMLRTNFDAGSIGQTKTYRAVTKGRSPASATAQIYANTAEGLETFSPTNLSKSISSGDITLTVVRRTRLSENWLRGIVPLGEDAEHFEFELFTSNTFATVRRVIASGTRSAIYTAAMQAADGYTSGPLYVRVYQLSGVVGRGRALQETI